MNIYKGVFDYLIFNCNNCNCNRRDRFTHFYYSLFTINYSLFFTRPSSAHSSSLATLLA